MPNLWCGVILIGIFLTITFTNCEPLVQIVKLPKAHPSVQKIIQQQSGETVPEVTTTVEDETVPDVAPIVGSDTPPEVAPIVGGDTAQENAIPWQVLFIYFPYDDEVEYVWLCGGTIINKKTILTAAHCTDIDPEQKEGYFFGAAGWFDTTTSPLPPAQTFDIEDIRQHKGYKKTEKTIYNDIALMITHDDLDFSTPAVQPVPCLANRKLDYLATCTRNDKCVTAGYGVYQQNITGTQPPVVSPTGEVPDDEVTADELQVLEGTNLVHYKTCWKALRGTGLTVLPTNICALDENQGFCFGDSGGFNGCEYKNGVFYQVGIPSWITSRDCSVGIQVFTRVTKYLRWIEYYKYK